MMTGDNLRARSGAPRHELIYLYWMHILTSALSECGRPPKIKKNQRSASDGIVFNEAQ